MVNEELKLKDKERILELFDAFEKSYNFSFQVNGLRTIVEQTGATKIMALTNTNLFVM